MGKQSNNIALPHLSSRLEKWLISKKLNHSCGPSSTLSKILETPTMPLEPICDDDFEPSNLRTPEKSSMKIDSQLLSINSRFNSILVEKDVLERENNSQKTTAVLVSEGHEDCEHLEVAVKKLSLTSTTASLDHDQLDPFAALLAVCGQSSPSTLKEAFSKYWFVSYSQLANVFMSRYFMYMECLAWFPFYALLYVCHELCG